MTAIERVKVEAPPLPSMSEDAAFALLGLMAAAWPNAKLSVESLEVLWLPRLVDCDPDTAHTALRQLIDMDQFPPSWARFREAYQAIAKRRVEAESDRYRKLDVAPARPEVAAMWRDKIRDQLGEAKGPLVNHLAAKLRLPPDVRRPDSDYFEDGPDAVETSATDNASQP